MTALGALDSSATIPDAGLASPNNVAYKVIRQDAGVFGDTYVAGTYHLIPNGSPSGSGGATAATAVGYIDPADYGVAGLTTKYRLTATLLTNATAPGTITFTAGFYPVSASAGGADVASFTAGVVTSGSTVAFTNPSASTLNQGNSGDFTAPAANYFSLAVVLSANIAADARTSMRLVLQYRNV